MASRISPYVDNTGLVFAYDLANVNRSYLGQPTTNNFGGSFRNFTGTSYSPDGEWVSSEPTRFTKTYYADFPTPIGPGATLIEESGTAGFHHLSRYGGGGEDGLHSLSCYLHPLASGITDFCIGMLGDGSNNIQFNLDTRVITYGGGISNRNAFIRDVPGWPGWLRVGANIEGRGGGWVGCIGYSSYTSYTGTAGGKKAYITGIQYEYTSQPTSFTTGTRSVTQGLRDLTGKSTIDLTNVSFDSNAQMTFDGTDDYIIFLDGLLSGTGDFTVEAVIQANASEQGGTVFGNYPSGNLQIFFGQRFIGMYLDNASTYLGTTPWSTTLPEFTTAPVHILAMRSGTTTTFYINGILKKTGSSSSTIGNTSAAFRAGTNTNTAEQFTGDIFLLRVFNRALTASEIQQNFNAIKGRYGL